MTVAEWLSEGKMCVRVRKCISKMALEGRFFSLESDASVLRTLPDCVLLERKNFGETCLNDFRSSTKYIPNGEIDEAKVRLDVGRALRSLSQFLGKLADECGAP